MVEPAQTLGIKPEEEGGQEKQVEENSLENTKVPTVPGQGRDRAPRQVAPCRPIWLVDRRDRVKMWCL